MDLWHLLSLDAPTVAAVWVVFTAWCAGVATSPVDPAAMFLAVWILYAADRLLDARPLFSRAHVPELRERHRFHHRFRSHFLRVIAATCIPLVFLLHRSNDALLHLYALLATLLSGWLILVHARPVPAEGAHRLPKELAVGLFFPAAVFLPAVSRAPQLRLALLPGALLFACLCCLNCLFLYAWEHEDNASGHPHPTTRWAVKHLPAITGVLCLTACLLACLTVFSPLPSGAPMFPLVHPTIFSVSVAVSAALLLSLHLRRRSFAPLRLRTLADLVLLSPLPTLAVVRLWRGHR